MIILDTSALYGLFRADDPMCRPLTKALQDESLRIVSPYVVAELDYLFLTRYGVNAEYKVLDALSSGAYELPTLGIADLSACAAVIARYRNLSIGVADASLVVLADRYGTNRIATLDRRHFSALRTMNGEPFQIVP